MSLFDSIKYPISDSIRMSEVSALSPAMLEAIRIEMTIHNVSAGIELAQLMRRVILDWDEE